MLLYHLKTERYASLISDLKETGHSVKFFPLEIGVRGIINRPNETTLKQIHKFCKKEITFKTLRDSVSKTAVSASYYIFLSRDQINMST